MNEGMAYMKEHDVLHIGARQRGHGSLSFVVRRHDNEATATRSVVDRREDHGVGNRTVPRKVIVEFGPIAGERR